MYSRKISKNQTTAFGSKTFPDFGYLVFKHLLYSRALKSERLGFRRSKISFGLKSFGFWTLELSTLHFSENKLDCFI